MVKVAWKVINGYGPYAYLQESVKNDGKVTSKHIAYLGSVGKKGLIPGKNLTIPPSEKHEGGRVMIPFVGDETLQDLKPSALAVVESLKSQVMAGVAKQDIVVPGKGKTASTAAAKAAPSQKSQAGKKGEGKDNGKVAPNKQASAAPTPAATPAPAAPKVLQVDGKPIVSVANAKKLEKAAATGDPKALMAAMHEVAGKVKKEKKDPVYKAASNLFTQMSGVPWAEGHLPIDKVDQAEVGQLDIVPKIHTPPQDEEGNTLLSQAWTAGYEHAAATGDLSTLNNYHNNLKATTWMPGGQSQLLHAGMDYAHFQLKEQIEDAVIEQAIAGGTPKVTAIPKNSFNKEPLLSKAEVQVLEAAAATGDVDQVEATAHLIAAKHAHQPSSGNSILDVGKSLQTQMQAITEAKDAPATPTEAAPDTAQVQVAAADVAPASTSADPGMTVDAGEAATEPVAPKIEVDDDQPDTAAPQLPYYLSGPLNISQVNTLEAAAKAGDVDLLNEEATAMGDQALDSKTFGAIHEAKHYLLAHLEPLPEIPSYTEVVVGGKQEDLGFLHLAQQAMQEDSFLYTPEGEPKVSEETNEKLLAAAVAAVDAEDPDILKKTGYALQTEALPGSAESDGVAFATSVLEKQVDKAIKGEKSVWWSGATEAPADSQAAPAADVAPGEPAGVASGGPAGVAPNIEPEAATPPPAPAKLVIEVPDLVQQYVANGWLSTTDFYLLQEEAANGNADSLQELASEISADQTGDLEKASIAMTTALFKKQIEESAAAAAPEVAPTVEQGPKDVVPTDVAPAGAAAPSSAAPSSAAPQWNQTSGPQGSTPGGLYEDQHGQKFYIKKPESLQHVRNELLAQDLYKAAGVAVLESKHTELDGGPAIASEWVEDMTGSGINPKDLPGTKEGFVADAWLANWDSVGVGSTKYDKILNLDGKAVRVDVGGALLFRGTGGPKGDKFGNEVTEIEGLRDPVLNPVAATVYGDMTPVEIKASAQGVLALGGQAIEDIVETHFSDDPMLAKQLTDKLIARRNYISQYVHSMDQADMAQVTSADVAPATASDVPSADFGMTVDAGEALPEAVAPKVPDTLSWKSLLTATQVKKLEDAAATGDTKILQQTVNDLYEKAGITQKAPLQNVALWLQKEMTKGPSSPGQKIPTPTPVTAEPVTPGAAQEPSPAPASAVSGAVPGMTVDAGEAAPEPVAPNTEPAMPAAPATPVASDGPPKITDIPTEPYSNKPMISAANVKKMETAAALGDIKLLQQTAVDATGKSYKFGKEAAVAAATQSLLEQMLAKTGPAAPAEENLPPVLPIQLSPEIPEEMKSAGTYTLSDDAVKQLEQAAAGGSVDQVKLISEGLPKPGTSFYENKDHNHAVAKSTTALTTQINAAKQAAADAYALASGKPKVIPELTYDDPEKTPPEAQVALLEKAAATGDKELLESVLKIYLLQNSSSWNTEAKGLRVAKESLLHQMNALAEAGYEPTPAAELGLPSVTTGAGVDSWIPTDKFGKPQLSAANIKKLKQAADSGDTKKLSEAMTDAADKISVQNKKQAVYKAGIALLEQMQGPAQTTETGDSAEDEGVRTTFVAKLSTQADDDHYDEDQAMTSSEIHQLEGAASTGSLATLKEAAIKLVNQTDNYNKKHQIQNAGNELGEQIVEAAKNAAMAQAVVTGKPAIAKVSVPVFTGHGGLVVPLEHVRQLETVAATGDQGFLTAATNVLAAGQGYKNQSAKKGLLDISETLKSQMEAIALGGPAAVDAGEAAPEPVAPNTGSPAPAAGPVKVDDVPKDNKGKALITPANIKKLEKAAESGVDHVDQVAETLTAKMLSPAKKAAILNVAAELKGKIEGQLVLEGDGGSGLGSTMASVQSGEVQLPDQETPSAKTVKKHRNQIKQDKKNYNADLEKISGQKGSNEGGLFKDKHLETLHYVKWPNSEARAKMEALTALLYSYAEIPVPSVRSIEFQDKDAVMSDWIEDAGPMTFEDMKKHPDVRAGFAADAWLANWDVVGLQADNVVSGPGGKAYRIDVGGSLLFRAQGKGRDFPAHVQEIETMRNPSISKQAGTVFNDLTSAEMAASAERVAAVTDDQIDFAVDSVDLPKTSPDYPASQFGQEASDLPELVKARLKQRRDYIVENVLEAQQKKVATVQELKEKSDLKDASVEAIVDKADKFKVDSPGASQKWQLTEQVMALELGDKEGKEASSSVRDRYGSWKGSSISPGGSMLRWAAGELHGEGGEELRRLDKFNEFLVKQGALSDKKRKEYADYMKKSTGASEAQDLVKGLRVTNDQNEVVLSVKRPGKDEITVYRGWKPDQVKYLELQDAKVGSVVTLDDPPLYSWSFSPKVAHNFQGGHGSFVSKASIPIDSIVLTDLANTTGSYTSEDEVVFKGVDDFKMEIIKKQ